MIDFAVWFIPVWLLIGLGVVSLAWLVTPRGERPDAFEFLQVALVAMICWPMLVWAFFHEEKGE